ncbi:MAG: hypothetical protein EZS28_055879, partial [Streblomastix strix]
TRKWLDSLPLPPRALTPFRLLEGCSETYSLLEKQLSKREIPRYKETMKIIERENKEMEKDSNQDTEQEKEIEYENEKEDIMLNQFISVEKEDECCFALIWLGGKQILNEDVVTDCIEDDSKKEENDEKEKEKEETKEDEKENQKEKEETKEDEKEKEK